MLLHVWFEPWRLSYLFGLAKYYGMGVPIPMPIGMLLPPIEGIVIHSP